MGLLVDATVSGQVRSGQLEFVLEKCLGLDKQHRSKHDDGRFRVAIDGEVIVAEFLNELRAHGYRIYHDYPTDYGNIDHIVVGRGGALPAKPRPAARAKEGRGTRWSL